MSQSWNVVRWILLITVAHDTLASRLHVILLFRELIRVTMLGRFRFEMPKHPDFSQSPVDILINVARSSSRLKQLTWKTNDLSQTQPKNLQNRIYPFELSFLEPVACLSFFFRVSNLHISAVSCLCFSKSSFQGLTSSFLWSRDLIGYVHGLLSCTPQRLRKQRRFSILVCLFDFLLTAIRRPPGPTWNQHWTKPCLTTY